MNNGKKLPGWVVPTLELGPILLFFLVFMRIKDETFTILGTEYSGFIVTTAVFAALTIFSTALIRILAGRISRMQLFTLVVVLLMGGLSIWLNDDHFIKMKPTMIYGAYGGVLLFGLLRGQLYLKSLMESALSLTDEGWRFLSWRVVGLFLILAIANEFVWRTQTTELWVTFKTFALTAGSALGMFYIFFKAEKFMLPPSKKDQDGPSA